MTRRIERRKIFLEDEDRDDFVRRLAALAASGALVAYAWSMMFKHARFSTRRRLRGRGGTPPWIWTPLREG